VRVETNESVEKVRTLVTRDRRLDIGVIPQEINMDKVSAIIEISTVNFSMWNVCAGKLF
jgi:hypothetical protein